MKASHLPCPCGKSKKGFSVMSSGVGRCFSGECEKRNWAPGSWQGSKVTSMEERQYSAEEEEKELRPFTPLTSVFRGYSSRGLTADTISRYKVDIGAGEGSYEAKYPIFDINNNHIDNKVRYPDKKFIYESGAKSPGLFGRHSFEPASSKFVTVVEGQDDAMAAYQMMGSKYAVLSVHSSVTAERDVRQDFEYLNSFDTIVFAFDNDEAGRKAAKAAASAGFPLNKVKILNLRRHKDANDYLKAGEGEAYVREWWQAPFWKPDGLKFGSDMLEEIENRPKHFTVPYPWDRLNHMTYGIRLSEAVLLMADTGVGKTSIFKEIEYSLLQNPDVIEKGYGVGFLHLEEPNHDTALGLLSIHNNLPYHLPDTPRTSEAIRKAHKEVLGDNRAVFYDHFGSNKIEEVLNKIRHMSALGCKYIFLDHLSIVVSDQDGDERKQLDEISTKLKTMTMELNIAVFAVIHTNRNGTARGSAGPEQVANIHLSLERIKKDPNEWRRNILKITVEKNRFCGRTGPCLWLYYNPTTGRLKELSNEEIDLYEQGEALRDDQVW